MNSWCPRLHGQRIINQLNECVADDRTLPVLAQQIGQPPAAHLLNASKPELFGRLNTSRLRRGHVRIPRSAFASHILDEIPGLQEHSAGQRRVSMTLRHSGIEFSEFSRLSFGVY